MRFEWEKAQNEIKELRTHTTKDFPHPTEPGKFIKIQSSGLLHAFTDEGFKEIGKEIPSYEFPEGLEITEEKDKHFIMDLPSWGDVKIEDEGKTVRVYDKKGVPIFRFKDLSVIGKDKSRFKVYNDKNEKIAEIDSLKDLSSFKDLKIERNEDLEPAEWLIENQKMYIKIPKLLKNSYPLKVFDETDTSSTDQKDATIDSYFPDKNFGGDGGGALGGAGSSGYRRRILIHYTLSSGSGIINTVRVYFRNCNSGSGTVTNNTIHQLTQTNWVEGDGVYPGNYSGVSWNKYDTTNNWNTPGGDFNSTVIDTVDSIPSNNTNWYYWEIMGSEAENPLSLNWGDNVHLLLRSQGAETTTNRITLGFKEHSDSAYRPYLEITYTPTFNFFLFF